MLQLGGGSMAEASIGRHLRRLRQARGMSIRALARATGLAPSLISQVERGIVTPSIVSLRNLAKALDTPVFAFFLEEAATTRIVVRRHERGIMTVAGSGEVYELLNPSPMQRVQMIVLRLEPGAATGPTPQSHPGEEGVVVLRGVATLELQGDVYELQEGDSAYYPAEWPHRYLNTGEAECELLFCMTPPA